MIDAKNDASIKEMRKQWEEFIRLIYEDLNDLVKQKRELDKEIKLLNRAESAIKNSKNDIKILLDHQKSIIETDPTLETKFKILDSFKQKNNLDNAVAIKIYKGIISSPSLARIPSTLISLKGSRDILEESIDKLEDIISGTAYDKETIAKLCRKNGLNEDQIKKVILYPLYKAMKKEIYKKPELKRKASEKDTKEVVSENSIEEPKTTIEKAIAKAVEEAKENAFTKLATEEETPKLADESYESFYKEIKSKYTLINNRRRNLINKYYIILNNMSEVERRCYIKYLSLSPNEVPELTEEELADRNNQELANFAAIKLFDSREKIEELIKIIEKSEYRDVNSIDLLEKHVESFGKIVDELNNLDKQIKKETAEKEVKENSKVFFATERGEHFIPDFIKEQGNEKSLLGVLKKGQKGLDEKKNERITRLKIYDSKYKEECGNNIYAITNYSVIVSYIKVKVKVNDTEEDAILILTAIPADKESNLDIQKVTKDILKKHRDSIIRQIKAIEKGDVQEIGLQLSLLEEMMKEYDTSKKEESSNGKKPKQHKQAE